MKAKIKKCPFCGGEAKFSVRMVPEGYRYDCPDFSCCGHCYGKWYATKEDAAAAWNKRA